MDKPISYREALSNYQMSADRPLPDPTISAEQLLSGFHPDYQPGIEYS